jgi:hypothetical protein
MATQTKPAAAAQGAAAAKSDEAGLRDFIREMKKGAKAINVLKSIGGNDPAMKNAIAQIEAKNAKLKEFALKKVARDIDEALKGE